MTSGTESIHDIPMFTGEWRSTESYVLPVTPSTSRVRSSSASTPTSDTSQSYPNTPHTTPRHRHHGRGRVTPCTPKTSERNTLLQWLATAKTPGSRDATGTREVSLSDSKKEGLKRKLTDFLGEEVEAEKDQENVNTEVKSRSPTSASKNVLGTSSVMNTVTCTPLSAAKMLKYGDDVDSKICNNSDSVVDVADSVKLIEMEGNTTLGSGFRKPVTNSKLTCVEDIIEDPTSACSKPKSFAFGNLSSPTANLPNFITDGTSPHKRPEVKVEKKRNLDWLTTFSHQKKAKNVPVTKSKIIIKREAKAQED